MRSAKRRAIWKHDDPARAIRWLVEAADDTRPRSVRREFARDPLVPDIKLRLKNLKADPWKDLPAVKQKLPDFRTLRRK